MTHIPLPGPEHHLQYRYAVSRYRLPLSNRRTTATRQRPLSPAGWGAGGGERERYVLRCGTRVSCTAATSPRRYVPSSKAEQLLCPRAHGCLPARLIRAHRHRACSTLKAANPWYCMSPCVGQKPLRSMAWPSTQPWQLVLVCARLTSPARPGGADEWKGLARRRGARRRWQCSLLQHTCAFLSAKMLAQTGVYKAP